MTDDPRMTAYLDAYAAYEGIQSEDHAAVAASLPDLRARAEAAGWDEVAFIATAAKERSSWVRACASSSISSNAVAHSSRMRTRLMTSAGSCPGPGHSGTSALASSYSSSTISHRLKVLYAAAATT